MRDPRDRNREQQPGSQGNQRRAQRPPLQRLQCQAQERHDHRRRLGQQRRDKKERGQGIHRPGRQRTMRIVAPVGKDHIGVQRRQGQASSQHGIEAGHPGDRLNLQWMHRKNRCPKPGRQPGSHDPPDQKKDEDRRQSMHCDAGYMKRGRIERPASPGPRCNRGDQPPRRVRQRNIEPAKRLGPIVGQRIQARRTEIGIVGDHLAIVPVDKIVVQNRPERGERKYRKKKTSGRGGEKWRSAPALLRQPAASGARCPHGAIVLDYGQLE